MNCKDCKAALPEYLLGDSCAEGSAENAGVRAHVAACAACADELRSIEATFALLDTWQAPEISPYFDQKLAVMLREEIAAPAPGWFERLGMRLELNTGRQFRPALAGAMALALIVGGGSVGFSTLPRHSASSVEASATVKDLEILNQNEQALQQLDQLLQDDETTDNSAGPPPS